MSRVQENAALAEERRAAATKDEDLALLNMVKALKELESMDLSHIHKLVELANVLKRNEQSAEASSITHAPEFVASASAQQ
jgi:hypothetical protein